MKQLIHLLQGAILGISNTIPGVSGGTMAMVMKIYDRLIHFVGKWNLHYVKTLISNILTAIKNKDFKGLLKLINEEDFFFIGLIAVGALLAVVLLSDFFTWGISNHLEFFYAFFCGLILISIFIPLSDISAIRKQHIVLLILVAVLTGIFTGLYDPAAKELARSEQMYEMAQQGLQYQFSYIQLIQAFSAGALGMSAMVLPGLSGSFVLLLLGQYFNLLKSISLVKDYFLSGDYLSLPWNAIFYLGFFALGAVAGVLLFTKLLNYLFEKHKDLVLAGLSGLILGSLYSLYPFRSYALHDLYDLGREGLIRLEQVKLYSNQFYLPFKSTEHLSVSQALGVILTFLAGALIMLPFIKSQKK